MAVPYSETKPVRPRRHAPSLTGHNAECILFQEVEDRDPTLLLDFGSGKRQPGVIQFNGYEAVRRIGRPRATDLAQKPRLPSRPRSLAEMAWASSPSERARTSVGAAIRAAAAVLA